MKKILQFVLAWAFLATNASSLSAQSIQWHSGLDEAAAIAAKENKLVLVHFTAEWCRPCKTLETFVFNTSQVQRAMQANIVAVKIDVDKQPNLVKEYGVSGVPFDVVITPAGRVVSKRSSPRDAEAYASMINGFDKTINGLANGNPSLNQNLDELKDQLYADNHVIKNNTLATSTPTHEAPKPSFDSADLKRRSKVENPYAAAAIEAEKAQPQTLMNQYAVQKAVEPSATKQPETAEANSFVAPANPFATGVAKAVPKTISNDFVAVVPPKSADVTMVKSETPSVNKLFEAKQFGKSTVNESSKSVISLANQFAGETKSPVQSNAPAATIPQPVAPQSLLPQTVNAKLVTTLSPLEIESPAKRESQAQLAAVAKSDFAPAALELNQVAKKTDSGKSQADFKADVKLAAPQPKIVMEDRFFIDESADSIQSNPAEPISTKTQPTNSKSPLVANSSVTQPPISPAKTSVLPENVALHGKCPVTLLKQGNWVDGDPQWGCVHRNRTYLFVSENARHEFQKDPDAFSPLLAGFDPVIFQREGTLVDGQEEHGVFMGKAPNQRVVLFSSQESRAEFQANPRAYIDTIRQAMQSTGGSSSNILR